MATQNQIDANRLNAQKSTGPKTPEGRAAVRLNGIKHGLTASESSLRRYVAVALACEAKADRVTVLKDDPPPGEEGQVDYGRLGMWFDPEAGRRRALWAFVIVLSASRHLFVRPTLVMDQTEWVAAHVAAAAFFGGMPERLVLDNLKDGVLKPDLYDPKLNRAYAEFAHHYGVLLDPARAGKPKDKALVAHCTSG